MSTYKTSSINSKYSSKLVKKARYRFKKKKKRKIKVRKRHNNFFTGVPYSFFIRTTDI